MCKQQRTTPSKKLQGETRKEALGGGGEPQATAKTPRPENLVAGDKVWHQRIYARLHRDLFPTIGDETIGEWPEDQDGWLSKAAKRVTTESVVNFAKKNKIEVTVGAPATRKSMLQEIGDHYAVTL